MKTIEQQSIEINDYIKTIRRELHKTPEIGLELPNSAAIIKRELELLGYAPSEISNCGIVAEIGAGTEVLLLRADYDGLPMAELADVDFCATNGNMHACGHDIHAAMLLGTAKLLKANEDKLNCRIRLMFQPGEETAEGAKSMIDGGVLTDVSKAYMIHVDSGAGVPAGKLMIPDHGPIMASNSRFDIEVIGSGAHGSMPYLGVDATLIAAHLVINLQSIVSRELNPFDPAVISVGTVNSGDVFNIIAANAKLSGTLRAFTRKHIDFLSERIEQVTKSTVESFRADYKFTINETMVPFEQDEKLANETKTIFSSLDSDLFIPLKDVYDTGRLMGSEDFSFISQQVPANMYMLALGTGEPYSLHNPHVTFDEEHLYIGAMVFTTIALHQ